jgi:hypothetical protein
MSSAMRWTLDESGSVLSSTQPKRALDIASQRALASGLIQRSHRAAGPGGSKSAISSAVSGRLKIL